MHLIFNYCLLQHHAQWENVKAGNPQYFKQQSVHCDHRALMHKQRCTERIRNIEYEYGHFPTCLCSVGFYTCQCKGNLADESNASQQELKVKVCSQCVHCVDI